MRRVNAVRSVLLAGQSFAVLLFLSVLCACSKQAQLALAPEFENAAPKVIALLPVKAPAEVRKERIEYLSQAFRAQLKNRGYLLLEDALVLSACADAECVSGRDNLARAYGADGIALVSISTLSRSNFLAGFVDIIKGELLLSRPDGAKLLSVSHSEQESGGLLLQSGQVLQGIKDQVRNYGDDGFNLLADKFAKAIALKVPAPPQSGIAAMGDSVVIRDVQWRPMRPAVYEVCAEGTKGVLASLVMGRTSSPLRSVADGRYCGVYRLTEGAPAQELEAFVEFRSAFGGVARKDLALEVESYCDVSKSLNLWREGAKTKLEVQPPCEQGKVLVYRAPRQIGPYQKVGVLSGSSWIGSSSGAGSERYQVLAVSPDGVPGLPVAPDGAS